jgi:DNA-binding transcriptional LysR family regulator
MELRQIEQFLAVAEEGQFSRAATRCQISQSALSTSIRLLERELGGPLFARTTRKVRLTEAGRALLGEARRALAAAASARESVLEIHELRRGSLRMGGIPTPGLLDQEALLTRFRDLYPGIDIRYLRDTSAALLREIEASRLDVALMTLPPHLPESVQAITIASAPLMFVCRPEHPLAGRAQVSSLALADEDFTGPLPGGLPYHEIDRIFAAAGKQRRVIFEVNEILTILAFVSHGLGVAFAPESLLSTRPELRAIPLTDPVVTWTLAAIISRDGATPATHALLALLPQPAASQ